MTLPADLLPQVFQRVPAVNQIAGREAYWPVAERLAKYNVPGASVCVIQNGEVVAAGGAGAKSETGAPVTADTIFAGASISKPVAALLALQLVDRGLLDLDQPVNAYLKAWKIPENDFTRTMPVTLRHLLSHRAGTTVHGFGAFPQDSRPPTLLEMLNGQPPSLTPAVEVDKLPGGSVRYSGGGTQIVQLLLEEQTGLAFADLAEREVFAPLGMRNTTFRQPLPDAMRSQAATGHDKTGAPVKGRFTFTPQLAAGGIYTTAPDYARFMVACRRAWLGKANTLLSQKLARAMMERQGDGQFALGWEIFGSGPQQRFAHGGSNEGYQCNAICLLEQGNGAVVMTNGLLGILLHAELINAVAEAYRWDGYLKPPRMVRDVPPDLQQKIIGRYRIISGVSAPHVDIWLEDGQLHSFVEGLILPPRPIYMGENGRFFTQQTPSETQLEFGADGEATGLTVFAEGEVELIRAVRQR